MNLCECHDPQVFGHIWANYKHGDCPQGGQHAWATLVIKGKLVLRCSKCGAKG